MQVNNPKEFQDFLFQKLTFQPFHQEYFTLFENPEHPEYGSCCRYVREGYYEMGIAKYTIPEDFSVSFRNPQQQLRFGTLFHGRTHFKLLHEPVSSFSPSSFLVLENDIKGRQAWRAGETLHGMEFTIYPAYFSEVLSPLVPGGLDLSKFIPNHTYKFLPDEIIQILNRILTLHEKKQLSPLLLEGLLLEIFAVFTRLFSDRSSAISSAVTIPIGKNRSLTLDEQDQAVLAEIHEYLTTHYADPPTVHDLSSQFFLPQQKLTYGFSKLYHMTVYEYILSLRMTRASELLTTTVLRIDEISGAVGYDYPANFIHAFKKTYGMTPRQFRRMHPFHKS